MFNKLSKIIIVILVFLLFNASSVEAKKPGFISLGGEVVSKVADFPDTESFQTEAGAYMDPGCIYKQFSIMFIPLWNYEISWCGYTGEENSYVIIDKATLDELAKEAKVQLPAEPSLPFWDSIGGKLLFVTLVGGFIAYSMFVKNKGTDENTENTEAVKEETNTNTAKEEEPK